MRWDGPPARCEDCGSRTGSNSGGIPRAAVVRRGENREFQMENALTRKEAVRGMTIWAAKSAFLEKEVGSLEPGKKADFILMNQDLMKVKDTDILKTKVTATYVGGKKVH